MGRSVAGVRVDIGLLLSFCMPLFVGFEELENMGGDVLGFDEAAHMLEMGNGVGRSHSDEGSVKIGSAH